MPTFSAPGGGSFEMRTGEPGASISALFRRPPDQSSGNGTTAAWYSLFTGVEVDGSFTSQDIFGWPLQGTITAVRFYVLGSPGDPASGQLLFEITGASYDVEAFRVAVQTDFGLLAFLTAGNDILQGTSGLDHMLGGAGDDLYLVNSDFDWTYEAADGGYDTVESSTSYALKAHVERLILTGPGGHTGVGNELNNVIIGNDDGNRIAGALGDDVLRGEDGADLLFGGGGDDLMIGGAGDDTYYLDGGTDTIEEAAGEGYDRVYTWSDLTLDDAAEIEFLRAFGSDGLTLTGNSGANVLVSGVGDDTLSGGGGRDRVSYVYSASAVIVDLAAGTASGMGDDSLSGFRDVLGSSHDDEIHGDAAANYLRGRGGHDSIFGEEGSDRLLGGDGDDALEGGAGADRLLGEDGDDILSGDEGDDILEGGAGSNLLDGGDGLDTVAYASSAFGVLVDLGSGVAQADEIDILISIERVVGSDHEDWLIGSDGADRLIGGAGDDLLEAGRGSDRLSGGAGDDLFAITLEARKVVITDFVAGAGLEDWITFEPGLFDDLADVLAHTTDTALGAVIAKDGVKVRLPGVLKADLHEDDFAFCGCGSPASPVEAQGASGLQAEDADGLALVGRLGHANPFHVEIERGHDWLH